MSARPTAARGHEPRAAAGDERPPAEAAVPLCIVTRPALQAGPAVTALRQAGLRAAALPLIEIAPPADAAAVRAAWAQLPGCALAMFVSANAVQHFFALRPADSADSADQAERIERAERGVWPAGTWAGCTGPGTAAALAAAGVPAAAIAQPAPGAAQDSEGLWAQLQGHDWAGRRVLVLRGEDGRDWLADTLRGRGAQVHFVTAYRRRPPQPDAAGRALLAAAQARPEAHLWLFSSSEAVAHLQALAPAADWSRSTALASHPRIAAAARAAGFGRVAEQDLGAGSVRAALAAGPGPAPASPTAPASIHSTAAPDPAAAPPSTRD